MIVYSVWCDCVEVGDILGFDMMDIQGIGINASAMVQISSIL